MTHGGRALLTWRVALMIAGGLVLLSSPAPAQNGTFGVDSYIPERFTDFEWRLSGSGRLSGSDEAKTIYDEPLWEYRNETYSNSDTKNGSLASFTQYRFETVPKSFNLRLRTSALYNASRSASGYSLYWDDRQSLSDRRSRTDHYRITVEPQCDGIAYVGGDFFASLLADAQFEYTDYPVCESDDTQTSIRFYPEVVSEDYSFRWNLVDRLQRSYEGEIAVLGGWGRVYEGRFAALALFLIEELRTQGILATEPTDDQMLDLTEIVYQYRLKHAVDERLHRIEATTAIADFLVANGIIAAANAPADYVIDDVWRWYPVSSRRFGLRVRAGAGYMHRYQSLQSSQDSEYEDLVISYDPENQSQIDTIHHATSTQRWSGKDRILSKLPFLIAIVEYFRPVNHRWQSNLEVGGRLYIAAESEIEGSSYAYLVRDLDELSRLFTDFDHIAEFTGSGSLRYILNTRTFADIGASATVFDLKQKQFQVSEEGLVYRAEETMTEWHYVVQLRLTYRIAIPTELTLSGSYSGGTELLSLLGPYRDYDNEDYAVTIGFSHYIY